MKEQEADILNRAFAALAETTDIQIEVEHYQHTNFIYDATGRLIVDGNTIPLAIKLTNSHPALAMAAQAKLNQPDEHVLIVADYVNPLMAERLKTQDIWFLDAVGNAYIRHKPLLIFIKGNKPVEKTTLRTSRAFQLSGLKVIYALFCNPELINAPYREIAQTAQVALGTVGWVITDLTQLGHIVDRGNLGRRLKGKRKLLERWIMAYPEKLRPKLVTGRYKATSPDWWQTADLPTLQAYWGGEVAAERLTHYLKPENITLYVPENEAGKLKISLQLRKDPNGNIEILNTFWDAGNEPHRKETVNPILIYADLLASGDPRNIETAQLIYEQELAQYFGED